GVRHASSITSGGAILMSGFVSISLTPMLCSRFLKSGHEQKHGFIYTAIERMFNLGLRFYDRTLRVALDYSAVTMAVSLALLVGTVYLFGLVPKGFLPSEDQGRITVGTE